jgi:nitrogen fixation protein FixH
LLAAAADLPTHEIHMCVIFFSVVITIPLFLLLIIHSSSSLVCVCHFKRTFHDLKLKAIAATAAAAADPEWREKAESN